MLTDSGGNLIHDHWLVPLNLGAWLRVLVITLVMGLYAAVAHAELERAELDVAVDDVPQILVLGDEFSVADVLVVPNTPPQLSWISMHKARMQEHNLKATWFNASRRESSIYSVAAIIDLYMRQRQPDIVVIAVGGNDLRYGYRPEYTAEKFTELLERLSQYDAKVVLVYTRLPERMVRHNYFALYEALAPVAEAFEVRMLLLQSGQTVAKDNIDYHSWGDVARANQVVLDQLLWPALWNAITGDIWVEPVADTLTPEILPIGQPASLPVVD